MSTPRSAVNASGRRRMDGWNRAPACGSSCSRGQAATALPRGWLAGQSAAAQGRGGMELAHVALLAQETACAGSAGRDEPSRAAGGNGCSPRAPAGVPTGTAAFFGVAAVAVFVDGHALEVGRADAAVRVVAVGADHLAFAHRMGEGPVHFGVLLGVAAGAVARCWCGSMAGSARVWMVWQSTQAMPSKSWRCRASASCRRRRGSSCRSG
jgi:hypothetical protein